jgi:predicted nucleic acid-binding protein
VRVIIDTPIWSLALRRKRKQLSARDRALVAGWADLIKERRVLLIGPIRQEILSGVPEDRTFERLREHLRAFEDEPLTLHDYEEAARCHNVCRRAGVAGSGVDFLLCAVALRRDAEIFTSDLDFTRYAEHLPLSLYQAPVVKE